MKEYSEKLLRNIERIDMNENLKELQRNWIGKSEGMQISFDIIDEDNNVIDNIDIFTTCVETIYGITFLVIPPEHNFIEKHKNKILNYDEVCEYKFNLKVDKIKAPVKQGDIVGSAEITDQDGNIIDEVDVTVKEAVKKANLFDYLLKNIKMVGAGKSILKQS